MAILDGTATEIQEIIDGQFNALEKLEDLHSIRVEEPNYPLVNIQKAIENGHL